MLLKSLDIDRITWGPDEGKFKGKVTYVDDAGSITLNLNEGHMAPLFDVVATALVSVSQEAARNLTSQIKKGMK